MIHPESIALCLSESLEPQGLRSPRHEGSPRARLLLGSRRVPGPDPAGEQTSGLQRALRAYQLVASLIAERPETK